MHKVLVASVMAACILSHAVGAPSLPRYHGVRAGETLSSIADLYGFSYQELACINGLHNPHFLQVGQKIALPPSPNRHPALPFAWPITRGDMTSPFGPRNGRYHHGIDIAAPPGTPVRAAASGRVVYSGMQGGLGRVVMVRHTRQFQTVYAHTQENYVTVGQRVRCGQQIAAVGSSGQSTGPHLHFEIREGTLARDPLLYLPTSPKIVRNRRP